MWFECTHEPTELGYDPDRVVKVSVGRLVEAIADALKVVEDAPPDPKWKKGDRAFVEVEVTGEQGGHTNFVLADAKHIGLTLPAIALQEIA